MLGVFAGYYYSNYTELALFQPIVEMFRRNVSTRVLLKKGVANPDLV
jgi:hypothetical protein